MPFQIDPFTNERIFVPEPTASPIASAASTAASAVAQTVGTQTASPAAQPSTSTPQPEPNLPLPQPTPASPEQPSPVPVPPSAPAVPTARHWLGVPKERRAFQMHRPVAKFNPARERLNAYVFKDKERQLVQQGRTYRSVTGRGTTTRKGATGTRMNPEDVEVAYTKLNQFAINPTTAPALSEREWDGIGEGLIKNMQGREILSQRQEAKKAFSSKLEESKLQWDSYDDMKKWMTENKADPLIADWAGEEMSKNVLSDRSIMARMQQGTQFQMDVAKKGMLSPSEISKMQEDARHAAGEKMSVDMNEDGFITWMTKQSQYPSDGSPARSYDEANEHARKMWSMIEADDPMAMGLLEEYRGDDVNEGWVYDKSAKRPVRVKTSKEKLDRQEKQDLERAAATGTVLDAADPKQAAVLAENGMSKGLLEFKAKLEDYKKKTPPPPAEIGITVRLKGLIEIQDDIASDVYKLVDGEKTYGAALKEVIGNYISAGNIEGISSQEAFNLMYGPVADNIDDRIAQEQSRVQDKMAQDLAERIGGFNEDLDNFVENFSHTEGESLAFSPEIKKLGGGDVSKGIESYILEQFPGVSPDIERYLKKGITFAISGRNSKSAKGFDPVIRTFDRVKGAVVQSERVNKDFEAERIRAQGIVDQQKTQIRDAYAERNQIVLFDPDKPESAVVEMTFADDGGAEDRMKEYAALDSRGRETYRKEEAVRIEDMAKKRLAAKNQMTALDNDVIPQIVESWNEKGQKTKGLKNVVINEDTDIDDWDAGRMTLEQEFGSNPEIDNILAKYDKKFLAWEKKKKDEGKRVRDKRKSYMNNIMKAIDEEEEMSPAPAVAAPEAVRSVQKEGHVRMTDPASGKKAWIPQDKVEEARANGLETI